jgi:hypothetical protein
MDQLLGPNISFPLSLSSNHHSCYVIESLYDNRDGPGWVAAGGGCRGKGAAGWASVFHSVCFAYEFVPYCLECGVRIVFSGRESKCSLKIVNLKLIPAEASENRT